MTRVDYTRPKPNRQTMDKVMTSASIARTARRVIAGCSLALLFAAGGGAALAHGGGHNGGDHFSNAGDHNMPPPHGPGSSHNPIVYQPPRLPPPIVKVGPAKPLPSPVQQTLLPCRDHRGFAGMPNVRDHRQRRRPVRCGWPQ
jgi:hypothetical protein